MLNEAQLPKPHRLEKDLPEALVRKAPRLLRKGSRTKSGELRRPMCQSCIYGHKKPCQGDPCPCVCREGKRCA